LAIFVVFCFVAVILFTKEPLNKAYIKFVMYAYPFIGIDLIPSVLSFNIFDLATFVFFIFFYKKPEKIINVKSPYPFLWIIFLILVTFGVFFSEEITRDTITSLIQLFSIYLFIVILYRELLSDSSLKKEILVGVKYLLIFSFVFLFIQYLVGPSFSFAKSENINVAGGIAIRYPSFFQDPQKYAQFLAALSFIVLIQIQDVQKNELLFSKILALIAICALLLTGGRAGLGGWLFGLLLLALFANAVYRTQLILVLTTIGLFAFIYQDSLPIFKRADLQDSYVFRQLIWIDALQIHQNHPWVGIGIGNYANYVSVHHPDQFWIHNNEITFFDHPESGYLKLLVEFGLTGFFFFSLLLLLPLYQAYTAYRKSNKIEHILYIAAIVSWLIGFYTVYSFGDIRIKVLIALILVLAVSTAQREKYLLKNSLENDV
jgi:O-antigen ligase